MGLNYHAYIKDAPLSDLLRQANIKTENQFMAFSGSSWQDCPDTGRSTGAYIIFYQGGPIDHDAYVLGPVSQSNAESEYNAACTAGMYLAHFRMIIRIFLNKDPYIFPERAPLIILDIKSSVCIANNGKDNKHTSHTSITVYVLRNGDICKMHKIDWC